MPINTEEATRLFDRLAQQLRANGAGTLVDQVIDEIAQGRQVVFKKVRKRSTERLPHRPEGNETFLERGQSRELAETLAYSERERLNLLLQAIERAVVDAAAIESDLIEHHGTINFVPEQREEAARRFTIGALSSNRKEVEHLRALVDELRRTIED
jgi:polyhydroxyalkanoate synthesis regulator phasin